MVNPLLPLLELQAKYAKQQLLEASGDKPTRRKRSRRRRKERAPRPLVLNGRQLPIHPHTYLGSPRHPQRLPPLLPRATSPSPSPCGRPGTTQPLIPGTSVSLDLMTDLLRYCFTPPLIAKLTEIFQQADSNKDRSLNRDELVGFMKALYLATETELPPVTALQKEVAAVFEKYDSDSSGELDVYEIASFLQTSHLCKAMKGKWKPKVGDHMMLRRRELLQQRLEQARLARMEKMQEEEARRRRWETAYNTVVQGESRWRRVIGYQEASDWQVIHWKTEELNHRCKLQRVHLALLIQHLAQMGLESRRILVQDFTKEAMLLKNRLVKESLNMVQRAIKLKGKVTSVSKEAEMLFGSVGYSCDLNQVLHDMSESSDSGMCDEMECMLEMYVSNECNESFSSDKWSQQLTSFQGPRQVEALAMRLEEYYKAKFPHGLNVLGEIAENLGASFSQVVQLASAMYRRHGRKFPNNSPSALVVMCLYTCEGKHIEGLLQLPEGSCPAVYKDINWALREGWNTDNDAAQETLRKWVGFILVLITTRVNSNKAWRGQRLYRGLMNLPQETYRAYLNMSIGDWVCWPAATSASLSKELVMKEFTKEGTSLAFVLENCQEGAEMWHVSMYAEELEMLLPPFTVFSVTAVSPSANTVTLGIQGGLGDGNTMKTGFQEEIDEEFAAFVRSVREDGSHEALATKVLYMINLQQELEKCPKVFLSRYSKLLLEEHRGINSLLQDLQQSINALHRVPAAVRDHLAIMWRHINNTEYLTRIMQGDFGMSLNVTLANSGQQSP